jgi:hypothetical protein
LLVRLQPIGIAEHLQIADEFRLAKRSIYQETGACNARACRGEIFDELKNFAPKASTAVYSDPRGRGFGLLAAEAHLSPRILASIMSMHMLVDDPSHLAVRDAIKLENRLIVNGGRA